MINYEVVLASGEIVEANASTNEDLFVALKGGSNNFGIVTRFDFPTFSQGQMWGGAIFYDASAVPQIIEEFNTFSASEEPNEEVHLIAGTSFTAGNENGVTNLYNSKPDPAPPSLKPFMDIPGQVYSSLREDSLLGFGDEQSAFSQDGARQLYFTTCFKLDTKFMLRVRELWLESLKPIAEVPGLSFALVFQPLTKNILRRSAALGPNALGLSPDDGPLVVNLLNTVHSNKEDDGKVVAAALGLIEKIDAAAAEAGKDARYRFMNYAYKGQKVIEGYGPESVEMLRAVSSKYDPDGFFQKMVPGGFKLPGSRSADLSTF